MSFWVELTLRTTAIRSTKHQLPTICLALGRKGSFHPERPFLLLALDNLSRPATNRSLWVGEITLFAFMGSQVRGGVDPELLVNQKVIERLRCHG